MKRALVMVSGGLDSTTVCYLLASQKIEIQPVFFDYGQHCAETEWAKVKEVKWPQFFGQICCFAKVYRV